MKKFLALVFSLLPVLVLAAAEEEGTSGFDAKAAERFAKLALACVHKEYPNKISHVLNSDADVAPPHISGRAVCERCTRRAQAKSDRGKFETGGDLRSRRRSLEF